MRTRLPAICVAFSLLWVAACGGGGDVADTTTTTTASGSAIPVVVDTDLALDDVVALLFLLSSPAADVRAVTVSGTGEVHCPHGLTVMGALLAVTGDQEIPVACGRGTPLVGNHAFPDDWREAADSGWGLDLSTAAAPATERTAVDLLAETLAPGGATLLTLGPLTNVAQAFRADPGLAAKVSSLVFMGGAVDVHGNVFGDGLADPAVAEWNAYVDPTAAAEVISSGAPVVIVGLDATNQAPVTKDFVEMLRANAHTDAASLAAELIGQNPSIPPATPTSGTRWPRPSPSYRAW